MAVSGHQGQRPLRAENLPCGMIYCAATDIGDNGGLATILFLPAGQLAREAGWQGHHRRLEDHIPTVGRYRFYLARAVRQCGLFYRPGAVHFLLAVLARLSAFDYQPHILLVAHQRQMQGHDVNFGEHPFECVYIHPDAGQRQICGDVDGKFSHEYR